MAVIPSSTKANPSKVAQVSEPNSNRVFLLSTFEWFSPDFHDPVYRGFERDRKPQEAGPSHETVGCGHVETEPPQVGGEPKQEAELNQSESESI